MAELLFVTGTDTGVGKTVAAAALARVTGAGVMKPLACGLAPGEDWPADALFLRGASGSSDPLADIAPVVFRAFRAPLPAARLEGREPDLAPAEAALARMGARHRALVLEGVGGVRVPLKSGYEVADWIRDLGAPALIVARSGLGTLNHTALSAEVLKARGVRVLGVLLNDGVRAEEDSLAEENAGLIREMTGLEVLGRLRPDPLVASGRLSSATLEAVRTAAAAWLSLTRLAAVGAS